MSERYDLVVRSDRAVLPDGERGACIGVRDGRIAAVEPAGAGLVADEVAELGADEVLVPGFVDSHVHVDEPGRTDWEGFETATRAALAAGVTTVVDMPLNSLPPTVDVAALAVKRAAAAGRCHVDVGFWGGAVPGNAGDLPALHAAGVLGFKCFTLPSGVAEFPPLSPPELEAHLRVVARLGALMLVHAEDAATVAAAPPARGRGYAGWLGSRPPEAEVTAAERVVAAARRTGARVHVLHLSSGDALPVLRAARADGLPVGVETCPHYLCFAAEQVPDGATALACCPPVRGAANRDVLWDALAAGDIDAVVTDHSPCPPGLKHLAEGDFGRAWGGVSSLQVGVPAVWTEARRRGHTLVDVVRWMASGPARVAGLGRKGRLAVGCDADLAAYAPDEDFVVDPGRLHHRHPVTPYAGTTLSGVARRTWLRGTEVDGTRARGRLLEREVLEREVTA